MINPNFLPEIIVTLGINCEYSDQCIVINNIEHNYDALRMVKDYCSKEGINCAERESIIRRIVRERH